MIKLIIRKHEAIADYFQEQTECFGSYNYKNYHTQLNLAAMLFRQRLKHAADIVAVELEVQMDSKTIYFHNGREVVVDEFASTELKEPLALRNLSSPSPLSTQKDSKRDSHSHNSGYAEKHL